MADDPTDDIAALASAVGAYAAEDYEDGIDPLSDRDKDRIARMQFTGTTYPNCRQRDKSKGQCTAHKTSRCPVCRKCPVCGGTLHHGTREDIVDGEHVKTVDEMTCVHCGTWLERDIHQPRRVRFLRSYQPPHERPRCSVGECMSKSWDGKTITIDGKALPVCDSHKRFHDRWIRAGADKKNSHLSINAAGILVRIPAHKDRESKLVTKRMTQEEKSRLGGKARYAKRLEREQSHE